MDVRGCIEQSAIDVTGVGIQPARGPSARRVEPGKEAAQVVSARSSRCGDEGFDDTREEMPLQLSEVLREHRPHALQHEIAQDVRWCRTAFKEALIEPCYMVDGLPRHSLLRAEEDRLAVVAGQEQQRVGAIRQLYEIELHSWCIRVGAWLPNLKAAERAQHHKPWSRQVRLRVGASAPVVERLVPVLGQSIGLAGTLHLHNAHSIPDQIEEPAVLRVLEARYVDPVRSIAGEQFVQIGLRLSPLRASVDAPLLRELCEATADLLAGDSHGRRGQTASCCARSGTA